MYLIEAIYLFAAIVVLSAVIPQIWRLIATKASDELSLSTWWAWFLTQIIMLMYMLTFANGFIIIGSVVLVAFYTAMLSLIIYYRSYYKPMPMTWAESIPTEKKA